jgi:hypothetical protein
VILQSSTRRFSQIWLQTKCESLKKESLKKESLKKNCLFAGTCCRNMTISILFFFPSKSGELGLCFSPKHFVGVEIIFSRLK